jgi:hypothetical protein
MLEKGEAVIPKEKNMADGLMDKITGGEKPKKEIDHVQVKKHKTGYHVEHHHTHPGHHPMESHAKSNMDDVMDHLHTHMGEPNPGEAEADGGQHGVPPEMAGPAGLGAGAPAAGASPAPGAGM